MSNLLDALRDARARTLALVLDLDDACWMAPKLPIVNPIRWEIGHVAWFQEKWILRHARGRAPLRGDGDALYDSAKVPHDTRWDLPLPDRGGTLGYLRDTLELALAAARDGEHAYFTELAICHEDMHGEALTYTRQTAEYAPPPLAIEPAAEAGPLPGDVRVPGGTFWLGAPASTQSFVFDNEKWAHRVEVAPFSVARAPVTNAEYARYLDAPGASPPRYWRRDERGAWLVRRYQQWLAIPPHQPVIHVSWHEAQAYCTWAGRRLPSEAEWELAAATPDKRTFPWGDAPPTHAHANLDARAGGPVDVAACAAGDSAYGCRQMIGNVWEWTATRFAPYPGFVVDPYAEYSAPWFATPHMVLRGGCWATRARLLRNTWRNFYPPDRSDVLAGFRTCAP